ncbi:ABC transporter substrate-binding protein [Flavimarina sp. Hel_I_48]|uniref:ABC transporter substrate-binding protein n=1 Tax=Flavimarina sp. Hel_I_48 TaxID=1392488 RepID=UPI0004DF0462|nr:helical backbone metal receptor [Flavimarina sp. Hel_I_48]
MEYKDQLGRTLKLDSTPRKIVCLVPSLSELLVDLGLENTLVGVTKFCVHPEHLRAEKTVVGGTKTVHFDRIMDLKPEIILCNKEENTQEIVSECDKIAPTHVSDLKNLEDVYALIIQYGKLFDVLEKSQILIENIKQKALNFQGNLSNTVRLKTAYLIWKNPYMVAGNDTFIDFLLEINGFTNIFAQKQSRYPEIEPQELKEADLVLLSSEPFPFKQKHIDLLKAHTSARIMLVDGEYFSWYGSRLLGAFAYFEKLQNLIKTDSSSKGLQSH